MATVIMSWFSDAIETIEKSFNRWFGSAGAETPEQLPQDTQTIIAPKNTTNSFASNTHPSYSQETLNQSNRNELSEKDQNSIREVANLLKDCGIAGIPKHIGNLDLSLPETLSADNAYNSGLNQNSLVTLHNHLQSPANQAAFNLGVQENIGDHESLEKFLLRHAGNIVGNNSNLKYFVAQLAENLVSHRNTEPSKLFRNNLRDCIANYNLLEAEIAKGITLQADAGASYVPNTNVGGVVLGQVSVKFR